MNGWTLSARRRALCPALMVALALPVAVAAEPTESWTQWGGPRHDFKAPAEGVADSWGEHGPKVLWTRELGDGYSTILVEDGRLYTMYRAGDQEAVICLDAATGETIWEHRYDHDPHEGHVTQFGVGPRATPLISGDRIYTIGVAGMMHSLNKHTGEVVWGHNLWGEVFGGNKLAHGYASSPIAYKDMVIALVGHESSDGEGGDGDGEGDGGNGDGGGKSIVAFDKEDGSVVWANLRYENSYSTPQILRVDGQEQLVAFMAKELIGVDPETGEELWRYPQENQFEQNINPPTLVDGRYLFLSSPQAGARGLKLTNKDGKTEVEELWSSRKIQFYHVTSVNDGDWVYGSSGTRSPAFMSAVNVKTGEIPWRKRGIGKANSVYADGRVIVLDEDGKLYLTTASPEDLTIHSEAEILDRVAWSAPTIVGRNMYVRDKVKIMALDLSASQSSDAAMAAGTMEPAEKAEATEAVETAEATEEVAEAEPEKEDSEAIRILKKVDAAAKAVTGVRYRAKAEPGGFATTFMRAAEGEAVMFGWNGQPEKFYGHVKTTHRGSDEPLEVAGGGDGETYFLIDHQAKKAYQDMDPNVMGSGRNALGSIVMAEFVHPTPFDDEINADEAELLGKETVAGVECYTIRVVYSDRRGESIWYVSTEDHLPRKRVRKFTDPQQGEGSIEVTITDLEVDPEVEPDTFKLELPEGYEKIDDFAP